VKKPSQKDLISAAVGVGVAILVFIGVTSYRDTEKLIRAMQSRRQAYQALLDLESLFSSVKDAETGQRGYLLTGKDRYLDPYNTAVGNIRQKLERLRSAVRGDRAQQSLFDRLQRLTAAKLSELDETIRLRKEQGFEAAQKVVLTDQGNEEMNDIRETIRRMETLQQGRVAAFDAETETRSAHAKTVLVLGSLVAVLLFALAGLMSHRGVAERRRAEEALRESEGRLHAIYDNSSIGIALNALDGRYVQVNQAFEQIFGYTQEELRGKTFEDITFEDERGISRAFVQEMLEGKRRDYQVEKRYCHKDGRVVWARTSAALVRDEAGQPRFLAAVVEDITARKQAEEAFERLTRQYESILNSAGEGIYGVDLEGKITFINPAAQKMLGWKAEEIIGRVSHALTHHTRADGTPYPIDECPIYASYHDLEIHQSDHEVFWKKDGTSFPVEYISTPIRDAQGVVVGAVVLFKDITLRKQVEEELNLALQMKTDFVSFATHQLRTPLAGIKWLLELALKQEGLPEDAVSLIQDARSSAQRLVEMVNDMLGITRLESGKVKLEPRPTNLSELTQEVLKDVGSQIEKKAQRLSLREESGLPLVCVDSQMFRQVILNLVSNAMKYTPSGGEIDIQLGQENGRVRWQIRDTGIGIPEKNQSRLFEKFFRADNVYKVETEGTGLGLYLARFIVERSGGQLKFKSEEGRGSTFYFTIPV